MIFQHVEQQMDPTSPWARAEGHREVGATSHFAHPAPPDFPQWQAQDSGNQNACPIDAGDSASANQALFSMWADEDSSTQQGFSAAARQGIKAIGGAAGRALGSLGSAASGAMDHIGGALSGMAEGAAQWLAFGGDPLAELLAKPQLTPEEISEARTLIAEQPEDKQGDLYQKLQEKVPYHNQRNNASTENGKNIGDVMCNLTSLAMALEMQGISNPEPQTYPQFEDYLEALRVEKKLPKRTDRAGWGGVAKEMGAELETLSENGAHDQAWWETNVRPKLRAGFSIMFSINGHIVRLQAVTDAGLVVDDPYGLVTLDAGSTWSFSPSNKNENTDPTDSETKGAKGEDVVWPWAEVEKHSMLWVIAIKRQ